MADEPSSIADRDWRLHHITTLIRQPTSSSGAPIYASGSPVEVVTFTNYRSKTVGIPLPSPVALYVSLAQKHAETVVATLPQASSFRDMPDGSDHLKAEAEPDFFDALENLFACVIFSHTALEAYANERIPDDFTFQCERSDKRHTEVYSKDQIERNLSLERKLHEVLPGLLSIKSPKGTALWERFIRLKELRDDLIHLKSSDWRSSMPEEAASNVWARLLDPAVPDSPTTAVQIMAYYAESKVPRWLRKWQSIHPSA